MASSPRSEREEERRHNIRTLLIASAASATAAAVTSQLWIRGTWIAAAITPLMVALVSELLNRPAEQLARWTAERPGLPGDAERPPAEPPAPPPRTAPPPAAGEAPVRIYRTQPASRRPSRRKLAIGTILATAGLAFVIAVVTITAGELIAGDSIGKGDRRTTFGGGKTEQKDKNDSADERQTDTSEERPTETEQETPSDQPTETETTPSQTTETVPAPAQETAPATVPEAETAPTP
jgi:hypothetical protein